MIVSHPRQALQANKKNMRSIKEVKRVTDKNFMNFLGHTTLRGTKLRSTYNKHPGQRQSEFWQRKLDVSVQR